jgi:hypothetical protein
MSDLSGYEIYYTTDSTSSTGGTTIKVSGGATVSYVISNLPAGTYYIAISAVDSTGLKSSFT